MGKGADTYRHKGLRAKLVDELRKKGISDERVLEAMLQVPRHLFFDKTFEPWAYKDNAFPIDCEQTISQPYTVAFQTSLLDVHPDDKILEIGLGSGYQACVLAAMGAKVYSLERHRPLYLSTTAKLQQMCIRGVRTFYGDGFRGLPSFAPFDKILVTAAAPEIPKELVRQLREGGILVIPVTRGAFQQMIRLFKTSDGKWLEEQHGEFRFVPMLEGTE